MPETKRSFILLLQPVISSSLFSLLILPIVVEQQGYSCDKRTTEHANVDRMTVDESWSKQQS